jgi:NOL1/NOP2/fmu family ribosome biogenesis protein
MASYLNLDESESLKAKVDERAPDIFQLSPGRPQLEVSRHFKKRNEENKEIVFVVRNQDVRNVFEIRSLDPV